MAISISSLTLYRWRYWISYGFIVLALISLLVFVGLYSPGGLSNSELASVEQTSTLRATNLANLGIINLPYHLLQHISLSIFGVSNLSIKLPSLVLGLFSAIGIVLLLRQWFRRNIAVIASFVAIANGQFLFLAQSGTPSIMYVFWPVWIILFATYIARQKPHVLRHKVLFFVFAALSLYTPMAGYTLLAMLVTVLLHPHFRYVVKNLKKTNLVFASVIGLVTVTPLIFVIVKNPSALLTLAGIPAEFPNIPANIGELANLYFGFTSSSQGELLVPIFGLGTLVLMAIGYYRLYETRASAQSYLLNIWILILIPLSILNPGVTAISLVPAILLIATGLDWLISYWYSLFPRNPYARIGGMIPIIALVFLLTASGLERYIYGYHYNPQLKSNFSEDVSLLKNKNIQLVVAPDEQPIYQVIAAYEKDLDVVTKPTASEVTYTKSAAVTAPEGYKLTSIITSSRLNDADRFYVYKKNAS